MWSLVSAMASFRWLVALGVTVAEQMSSTLRPSDSMLMGFAGGLAKELSRYSRLFTFELIVSMLTGSPEGVTAQFWPLT